MGVTIGISEKYNRWKNVRTEYRGATQALQNLLEVLQVKPVGGGRSRIEEWDSKIRAHWSPGDPIYAGLLPLGREPFTSSTRAALPNEVEGLAVRLGQQSEALLTAAGEATGAAPALLTEQGQDLAALRVKVAAFSAALTEARYQQKRKEGQVDQLSRQLEPARVRLCEALYKNMASLIALLMPNQREVAAFYDLALIMAPPAGDDEEEPEKPAPK